MYLVGLRWSLFGLIASGSDIFFFFQKFRVKALSGACVMCTERNYQRFYIGLIFFTRTTVDLGQPER